MPDFLTASKSGRPLQLALILGVACLVGVCSGLFGVGGGVILVPLLVILFHYEQHVAQGTSLVALVPPTGLLAFINYSRAHEVNWIVGLLIMPGVILGGLYGSRLAQKLSPRRMRRVFAGILLVIGAWQIVSAWILHLN
jgi:uncharacterized membrane protein YfcA